MTLTTLGPLAMLTYESVRLSSEALEHEIEGRLASTAEVSAVAVGERMEGLAHVVESFAGRPSLIRSMSRRRIDRAEILLHLRELRSLGGGLSVVFLTDRAGQVVTLLPLTPALEGEDFSFRDWYRGVMSLRSRYVSEAFEGAAAGRPSVVVAAAPVRSSAQRGGSRRIIGVLGGAYDLTTIKTFVSRFETAYGTSLVVTDQRGVVVAAPEGVPTLEKLDDELVQRALAGGSGAATRDGVLYGYAAVPSIGWTVRVSVPATRALSGIREIQFGVYLTAGVFGVVLILGLIVFVMALRRLAHERNKSAAILASMASGVVITDPYGTVTAVNPALEELLGMSGGELVGRPFWDVVPAFDSDGGAVPRGDRFITTALLSGEVVHSRGYDLFFERRDGRRVPVNVTAAPIVDANKEVMGAVEVIRDSSVDREIDELKSSLVSTVSHELRTPLTMIQGFSELLMKESLNQDQSREAVEQIHNSALRLSRLIEDLLSVSRIESGRLRVHLQQVNLRDAVAETLALFPRQSARMEVQIDEALAVHSEYDKVVQIVTNLVSNALKYSPDDSIVTISAERDGSSVVVSVRDRGIGFSEEDRKRIFQKFFRVDRPEVRKRGGTGLGLYITKGLVEAQGGQLWHEPGEGGGSVFSFALPVSMGEI